MTKTYFCLLVLSVVALDLPSFYHHSMDIQIEMQDMVSKCPGLQYETAHDYPRIGMLSMNKGATDKKKAFILFGEHARELISPETGLHFVDKLCHSDDYKDVKENYELRMILNLNVLSRQKVEKGEFCLRENENGVDLNRNYKAHWNGDHDPTMTHTAPGPFAFSEAETQTIRDQLREFKPQAFLSIHSGTLGLFAPYAYEKELAKENMDNMLDILGEVKDKYCKQCKMGSCGKEIGYLSPGTSMDYAYDELKIPYSFTFEIFHGEIDLRQKKQPNFLEVQESNKLRMASEEQILDQKLRSAYSFAQSSTMEMSDEACFCFFNPPEKDQYDYYIENWSHAIGLTLSRISQKLQNEQKS